MSNNTTTPHPGNDASSELSEHPDLLLFFFIVCIFGTSFFILVISHLLLAQSLVHTNRGKVVVSYKVFVFAFGMLVVYLDQTFSTFRKFLNVTHYMLSFEPESIRSICVPVFMLYQAFSMDSQAFRSASVGALTTITFGYALWTFLQGLFCFFVFWIYDSPFDGMFWITAFMFGSIISVSAHGVAKEAFSKLGRYPWLIKYMEAESFISVGASLIVYDLLVVIAETPNFIDWHKLVLYAVGQILIIPLVGHVMGVIAVFWLKRVNGMIYLEITISFSMAFMSYYVAAVILEHIGMRSAGALTIMNYGLFINKNRDSYSLGYDMHFQQFLRIMEFIVSAFLYAVAGGAVTMSFYSGANIPHETSLAVLYMIVLANYGYAMITRAVGTIILKPLLTLHLETLTWQEVAIMTFSESSHPLTVLLALCVVYGDDTKLINYNRDHRYKTFLCLVSLSVFKLLVNGSLINIMLYYLGVKRVSVARQVSMLRAFHEINSEMNRRFRNYKCDKFLADADWDVVKEFVNFDRELSNSLFRRHKILDSVMSAEHSLEDDVLLKSQILHGKKMSYWRQYEHGMLSLEALRILLDKTNLPVRRITLKDTLSAEKLTKYCTVGAWSKFLKFQEVLKKYLDQQQQVRSQVYEQIKNDKFKVFMYRLMSHPLVIAIFDLLVLLSGVTTIFVLLYMHLCLTSEFDHHSIRILWRELNVALVVIIQVMLILRMIFVRVAYTPTFWNIFRFVECTISWPDIIVHEVYRPTFAAKCFESSHVDTVPEICCKVFVFLRLLRWVSLFGSRIQLIISYVDLQIHEKLRLGGDISKGFITGCDDISQSNDLMVDDPLVHQRVVQMLTTNKNVMMSQQAAFQKTFPGVVISVKSQHAGRIILTGIARELAKMRKSLGMEDDEVTTFDKMISFRRKQMLRIPPNLPMPPIQKIIREVPWLSSNEFTVSMIQYNAEVNSYAEGDKLYCDQDPLDGLHVILSGLLQFEVVYERFITRGRSTNPSGRKGSIVNEPHSVLESEVVTEYDYYTSGMTLGELALLTGESFIIPITCVTAVRILHIPFETIMATVHIDTELEMMLWKLSAIRTCASLLRGFPLYKKMSLVDFRNYIDKQCKLEIRNLSVPSGYDETDISTSYSLIEHRDSDVVLVFGVARTDDGVTFDTHSIIPSGIDRLLFSPADCDKYVLCIVPPPPMSLRSDVISAGSDQNLNQSDENATTPDILSSMSIKASNMRVGQAADTRVFKQLRVLPRTRAQQLKDARKKSPTSSRLKRANGVRAKPVMIIDPVSELQLTSGLKTGNDT